MIALSRYQLSLLLRSHRWIAPAVLFALGVIGLGGAASRHGATLGQGLAWSALMLVPVEAWLTRSMLTAEPAAARACVAAAGGPRRTQLAALIAPTLVAAAFGLVGIGWQVSRLGVPRSVGTNAIRVGKLFSDLARSRYSGRPARSCWRWRGTDHRRTRPFAASATRGRN